MSRGLEAVKTPKLLVLLSPLEGISFKSLEIKSMQGKIITIEGLDGAGKSTQIKLLTERLTQLGRSYKFIHFPLMEEGVYGELVAEFLRGEFGALEQVHPKLVALLFAENRAENKTKMEDWLEEGNLVILDRYVKSNIAFQCAKVADPKGKEALKKWILDFEFGNRQLPKPKASFFLNVPITQIEKSLQQARKGRDRAYLKGKSDIHEDSMDLQKNVLQEYKKMLQETSNFFEVNCFSEEGKWLSPQEIHEYIFAQLDFL